MKNKVCIILPVFNSSKTIANAIESVINQTHKNWTLFIVDDASTDDSLQIIQKYKDKFEGVIVSHENNQGVSAARNTGLKTAKNLGGFDFIAYLNSDDTWENDHLEQSIAYSDHADIVYCDVNLKNELNEQMFKVNIPDSTFDPGKFLVSNFIYIPSVIHRFSVYEQLGEFDSSLDSLEDYDYWLRAVKSGLIFIEKPNKTCNFLVRKDSLGSKGQDKLPLLWAKHPDFFNIKLNLGCGDQLLDGFLNCDLYSPHAQLKFDAQKIPFPDNSVGYINASHLIEHFHFHQAFDVLKEWQRALKPGGTLAMETPDFFNSCKAFVEGPEQFRIRLYGHFFAWPNIPGQTHYFLYTEQQLGWTLNQLGFKNIRRVPPDSIYARSMPGKEELYLKMLAEK